MEIKTVGLVGLGVMGAGIAQVLAEAGFDVIAFDINDEIIQKSLAQIERMIKISVRLKRIPPEEQEPALKRIRTTTNLYDLRDSHFVIEAVPENINLKKDIFRKLDEICNPETIFATNTSSLSVTDLASSTNRPEKFTGLHFFNPPTETQLVEVVRALKTSDETFNTAFKLVKKFKKTPIEAKDTPGFIVNRLMVPFLNEGARMVEEGVASAEEIDRAWRLATGMPKGPLELIDLIGTDVASLVSEAMYREFRASRFHSPPIIRQFVRAGFLGKKSGRGFYNYSK